jgi:2-polyprenyl-3-methyl-5-hydroxy-6-metoxy-1,4-benzoquinol methylase
MNPLVPDRLVTLWDSVVQGQLTEEEFRDQEERLRGQYRQTWQDALLLTGHHDLAESLVAELAEYLGCPPSAVERRCRAAETELDSEWQEKVDPGDRLSVERYYEESQAQLYDLILWHTLKDDDSPLAYVVALELAGQRGCRSYLDFGSGVGSGGLLFAQNGFTITQADIAAPVLQFARWRLERRQLAGNLIDLKKDSLPDQAFDLITAMDVFEHLYDPVAAVTELWKSLKPGGFLFGRLEEDSNEIRLGHIVGEFGPVYARMQELGLVKVWQDEWCWGHEVFQKQPGP